jgi:hypothetical protein
VYGNGLRANARHSDEKFAGLPGFAIATGLQTPCSDRNIHRSHSYTLETAMNVKQVIRCTTAASLALLLSTAYAAGDDNTTSRPMTGKEKATAIGAGTGAVAGAVVGGPVGALVGAGVGGYIGHEGTDAQGRVTSTPSSRVPDGTVRSAQAALEAQGYSPGAIDGQMGPNTRNAILRFQQDKGLTQTGALDGATLAALNVR